MQVDKLIKNWVKVALLVAFILPVSLLISCVDDDDINSGMVELLSFGPSGVKHGDKIKFIGINMDKVTAIVLPTNVEIPKSQFATQNRELIEIVVPMEAEAGRVFLKAPQGEIESKTMLNFEVPVVINSITSSVKPGENITISGTLLNWIEEVVFFDGLSVTEFVSQSLTELVVTVPMEAETGHLLFRSGGTDPLSFVSENPVTVTLPSVIDFANPEVRHTEQLVINGIDLDLVTAIEFAGGFMVSEFVSQSITEITVVVPAGALKGRLVLHQASPISVQTTQEVTIILPVGTEISPAVAEPGVDDVTINGKDLDLVAELVIVGAGVVPSTAFSVHTDTQIVFPLPDGALNGGINYTTIHGYSNSLGVSLITPGPGPKPLAITMYDDAMAPGGGDWSWNTEISDPANTEQVYSGTVSWKFQTPTDGGVSSGGMNPINASGMEYFAFSVFGGPGTNGAQLAAILNDNWGNYNSVTIVEGQWTEYKIPLSAYPDVDHSAIVRWILKVEGMNGSTIWVDRIGFEPGGPEPLPLTLYDGTLPFGGGDWGWNASTSDSENTEQVYIGDYSWKYETSSGGGMSVGGIDPVNASNMTYFSFALFGGAGTSGAEIAVILNDNWNDFNTVSIVEGEWTEYRIPLSNYGSTDISAIVRFAIKPEVDAAMLYIDRVGFE